MDSTTTNPLKNICLLCQDYVDHITSKCPNNRCKLCRQLGHVNRDCPNQNNLESKEKVLSANFKSCETSSLLLTNNTNTIMKILPDEKNSKLQNIYSHESTKPKKSKPKARKNDEIREKSRTSKEEDFRKRMNNNNFESYPNSQKYRKREEKTRKGIAAQFFSNSEKEDEITSSIEQKSDSKIRRKITLNISTLVVTELLHQMIDSIFKSSQNTSSSSFVKNSKRTLDDDDQSIESGEIKSDFESSSSDDPVVLENSKEVVKENFGHTCKQDLFKICPKCIHFKFQGSKNSGPGYRESHKYSSEFHLELSTDIFDLLKRQKINLALVCVQNTSSFKILENSITLKNRIREIESAQIQVQFYSRHQPEQNVTFHELAQKFIAQVPQLFSDRIKECQEDILDATEYSGKYSDLIFPNETRQVKLRLTRNTFMNPGCKVFIQPYCHFIEILDPPTELCYDRNTKDIVAFTKIKNKSKDNTTFTLREGVRIGKIFKLHKF